ncbi:hypothetical protein BDP27DRAFT_1219053 [Rhodocollybia butyracea]|uniref:Kinetochore protein Sos7 coiled-coil domain-containing protein n=1 Tax=Rhodocollybia butyracea TaxID=206335 RepID=A0A9P5U9Y8_9AGAR|nr:hypothetical protein BDP27DRAFT_1219053 [Rhodocollybia butyracea]
MDQEKRLFAAQSRQALFDSLNLGIVRSVTELNSHELDLEDNVSDVEEVARDPAVVAGDVSSQVKYLKKLKFQYLEQNAKHKYIQSIVSDIDDAPIVTEDDNNQLEQRNSQQKENLKDAKAKLTDIQTDIRRLAPTVEEDYIHVKEATATAADLAQKIIDARLALSRLRQTHPHPRVTIQTADKKLQDQVDEMQALTDEKEVLEQKVEDVKASFESESLKLTALKSQRNELEKSVKTSESVFDDDRRFVPLYDWLTGAHMLHRSMQGLEDIQFSSENELRLTYRVDAHGRSPPISITLLFIPNSRQLAAVTVTGLEDREIDLQDIIEAHLQMNNVRGVLTAILAQARDI